MTVGCFDMEAPTAGAACDPGQPLQTGSEEGDPCTLGACSRNVSCILDAGCRHEETDI